MIFLNIFYKLSTLSDFSVLCMKNGLKAIFIFLIKIYKILINSTLPQNPLLIKWNSTTRLAEHE